MEPQLSFPDAARIVAVGLDANLFNRTDIVAWADRRIAELAEPPFWLLELATRPQAKPFEISNAILRNTSPLDPLFVCGALLALLPPLETVPDRRLGALADHIYVMVHEACQGNWRHKIVGTASWINEMFSLMHDGYGYTLNSIRADIQGFLQTYSNRWRREPSYPSNGASISNHQDTVNSTVPPPSNGIPKDVLVLTDKFG